MGLWLLLSLAEPAYIIYYLVTFLIDRNGVPVPHEDIIIFMIIIGGVALLFRIFLVIMSIRVISNFGAGLKKRVFEKYESDDVTERSPLNVDL